jgi:heterotetrameric sarcosine oxidase delta subunit
MSAAPVPSLTCIDVTRTMLRIPCPWCGERDEIEFRYRGDAARTRPAAAPALADTELAAFSAYLYERDNPCGWHAEWWLHVGGCRRLLRVVRHTLTHDIRSVSDAAHHAAHPLAPGEEGTRSNG